MRFDCGFHQLGLPPVKLLTFGVPVAGLRDWFGREYRTSSILPFNHPGGIDGVSGKGFEAFTVSFSEDYLADVASSFHIPVPEWLRRPSPESIIDRGALTNRFRDLLNRLIIDSESGLAPEIEHELVVTLLHAAENGSAATDRSTTRLRTRALERALAYIEDHPDEAVSVRDICSENDIALRTLNRAFNERFGVGPKAYLKRRRLSAVRTEILSSPPRTQVTGIANRWGFWHMGQFADDYRNLFGELPSRTMGNQSLREGTGGGTPFPTLSTISPRLGRTPGDSRGLTGTTSWNRTPCSSSD
jgi:AraC-like DNA-binding protein